MTKLYNADCLEKLKELPDNSVDSIVTDPPAGISFMGKDWDDNKGGKQQWIAWLSEVFIETKRVLKPGGHALVWSLPRTSHWTATALEDAGYEVRDCVYHIFGSGFPKSLNIGKAVDKLQGNEREKYGEQSRSGRSGGILGKETEIVRYLDKGSSEWEGWGTALKPAVECWWLVRRPLSEKTVAENVLKWGTGGLNIEGSRVPGDAWVRSTEYKQDIRGDAFNSAGDKTIYMGPKAMPASGRFPAHLIHDGSEEVLAGFPNDSARYFYCAKPSKAERDRGCEGMEERAGGGLKATQEGRLKDLRLGDDYERPIPKFRNHHPTVKAQALMQYLIKLITPPKGTVLDPFMGSGSTGVAAKTLGVDFIGIEKEEEYFKIAEARMSL